MRLLALDVDGVLNSMNSIRKEFSRLNSVPIEDVEKFLDERKGPIRS